MSFDPDTFMSQTVDAPQGDTTIKQVPPGEYLAMIDSIDSAKHFGHGTVNKPESKNHGNTWAVFRPSFILQDAAVQAEMEREKVTVGHKGMFLDLDGNGNIDFGKGKNVDLNRLREAVGQNKAGPWGFANLSGAGPVMVKVTHEVNKDTGDAYARVSRVTAAK